MIVYKLGFSWSSGDYVITTTELPESMPLPANYYHTEQEAAARILKNYVDSIKNQHKNILKTISTLEKWKKLYPDVPVAVE